MRVKSIRISRDNLCSRLPGVIPSLVDSWSLPKINMNCGNEIDVNTFYSYSSAVSKAAEYGISSSLLSYDCNFEYLDNNYGLIVSDIIIPNGISSKVSDYTDFYVNIPDGNGGFYDLNDKTSLVHYEGRKIISGGTEIKILTYYSIIKWYNFFKKYYETKGKYDTAFEFYENEYELKNATDEQIYLDMDALFEARGGNDMYEWMKEKCFVSFNIPDEFIDEWKTDKLCYSDALKWQKWFNDRVALYSKECKDTGNCCECQEFNRLGGSEMLEALNAWINERKAEFEQGFEWSLNSASYTIPITLNASIDDLGEMSIFSSEYKDGVDYHNTLKDMQNVYMDEENGGTVVHRPYYKDEYGNTVYLYDTFIIKNSKTTGYKQNEFYENEFNNDDWLNYSDFYIRNHPEEFATNGVTKYAYSKINGKILYNQDYEDEVAKYSNKQYALINNMLIEVIDGEYVIPNYNTNNVANLLLKTEKIFPVIKDGVIKYVELNDKKYYVKKDSNNVEKVYFLKDSNCYDEGSEVIKGKYIIYNNNIFLVNGDKITLLDYTDKHYTIIDGYFEYNGQSFYIINDKIMVEKVTAKDSADICFNFVALSSSDLDELGWESYNVNPSTGEITIRHKIDFSYGNIITGYTDSKLDLLRRRKINTDELGNELPGYFDLYTGSLNDDLKVYNEPPVCEGEKQTVSFNYTESLMLYGGHYNTPYNECTLDLLYKVGEVSELKKYSDAMIIGDYLYSIEFYYLDENNNHINSTFVEGEDSRPYLKLYDEDGEKYIENQTLYCDITYLTDVTLRDVGTGYVPDLSNKDYIKYVDTTPVYKEIGNFYMGDGTYFTFKYYLLPGLRSGEYISDFNDDKYVNLTRFEFCPALYLKKEDLSLKIESTDFDGSCLNDSSLDVYVTKKDASEKYSPWDGNNGLVVFPVFRQEYNLGSSVSQNVDTNIYIDRGINAAFENHLKLLETHTMESLENYGNGYFKINKY